MNFLVLAKSRYSVRKFDDRPIEQEKLDLTACGIINDHVKDCHSYKRLIDNYPVKYISDR